MSDNTSSAEESVQPSSDGTSENQTTESIAELKAQLERAEAAKRDAIEGRQKVKEKLRDFESRFETIENEKLKKTSDVEELRKGYETKFEELKRQAEEFQNRYRETVLDKEVISKASKKLTDAGVEYFLLKNKANLEIDENGQVRVANSPMSVDELIDSFANETGLAVSSVRPGTGNTKAGSGGSGQKPTKEQVLAMGDAEQRKVFAEHPELADEIAADVLKSLA